MEDITKELNSATEYLRAMRKSGHHKGDCDNMLMHLANIEDLVNELFIANVRNCNDKQQLTFDNWLKENKYTKKDNTFIKEDKLYSKKRLLNRYIHEYVYSL